MAEKETQTEKVLQRVEMLCTLKAHGMLYPMGLVIYADTEEIPEVLLKQSDAHVLKVYREVPNNPKKKK